MLNQRSRKFSKPPLNPNQARANSGRFCRLHPVAGRGSAAAGGAVVGQAANDGGQREAVAAAAASSGLV